MSSTTLEAALAGTEEEQAPDQEAALFDKSRYDDPELAIPKVDSQAIDRIWVGFAGGFFLDRSDPQDVAFYNRLVFQRDVTLNIDARCSSVGAKGVTDRDGDLDVVVGKKVLKVHSARISTADGLVAIGTPDDQAEAA